MAKVIRTQMKAIRAKCLDCCCNDTKEVDNCIVEDCPFNGLQNGKDT